MILRGEVFAGREEVSGAAWNKGMESALAFPAVKER